MNFNPNVPNIPEVARVAISLVMRDAKFRTPVREIGVLLGQELAAAYPGEGDGLTGAIASFTEACRQIGFVRCTSAGIPGLSDQGLRFEGCEDVLGYHVVNAGRTLCSFDEGLIEAYLNQLPGLSGIFVRETECLGKGDASCLFVLDR